MYVAIVPNRSSPPAILLRESYRADGKVRSRTLANLSDWPAEKVEALRAVLRNQPLVPASRGSFEIRRSLPHGHVAAALATARCIGLDDLLPRRGKPRQRRLALALIIARLLDPAAKLATARMLDAETASHSLGEVLDLGQVSARELYATLDWLVSEQPSIEATLARRHLKEGALVFYDVTSTYLEGRCCPLARHGYSRDHRGDRPQLVIGLLCAANGCPIAVEVFAGNTADPATLVQQIQTLRQRFKLHRVVVVGDRGMITDARIEQTLRPAGLDWISALRAPAIWQLAAEGGPLQLSLFDQQNLAEIHSPDFPGERLVACHNPLLGAERGRKRQALLAATETELSRITRQVKRRTKTPLSAAEIGLKVGRVLNRYKMAKHFTVEVADGQLRWARNLETIQREQQLDGLYVIRTSEPEPQLSAPNAVRHYKSLSQVEQAFRCLKGTDLRVRPIHHRTEDHVRAHIFLCLLAYYVEWHMRQALAPLLFADEDLKQTRATRDPVATAQPSAAVKAKKAVRLTPEGLPVHSFDSLLEALATRCRNTCRVTATPSKASFSQLTQPTPLQARTYQLLGL